MRSWKGLLSLGLLALASCGYEVKGVVVHHHSPPSVWQVRHQSAYQLQQMSVDMIRSSEGVNFCIPNWQLFYRDDYHLTRYSRDVLSLMQRYLSTFDGVERFAISVYPEFQPELRWQLAELREQRLSDYFVSQHLKASVIGGEAISGYFKAREDWRWNQTCIQALFSR